MKNLILCAFLLMAFSCDKKAQNEFKLSMAEKAGAAVETVLNKEFSSLEGMSCHDESQILGEKVEMEVAKLLKADDSLNKSISGDLAQYMCKSMMEKVLPMIVGSQYEKYPCSLKAFGIRMSGLSEKICSKIKL